MSLKGPAPPCIYLAAIRVSNEDAYFSCTRFFRRENRSDQCCLESWWETFVSSRETEGKIHGSEVYLSTTGTELRWIRGRLSRRDVRYVGYKGRDIRRGVWLIRIGEPIPSATKTTSTSSRPFPHQLSQALRRMIRRAGALIDYRHTSITEATKLPATSHSASTTEPMESIAVLSRAIVRGMSFFDDYLKHVREGYLMTWVSHSGRFAHLLDRVPC